jgi:hypothetical protein
MGDEMTVYELGNEPNQTFRILYDGEPITVSMRWVVTCGFWMMGVPGVVEGVRVVPGALPLLTYGYPRLTFFAPKNELSRDLTDCAIVYLEEAEADALVAARLLELYQKGLLTEKVTNEPTAKGVRI